MEKKESYSNKVNKICEVVASRILERRANPIIWPVVVIEPYWYIKKYFLKELYATLAQLKEKGMGKEEIADLFLTPSRICYMFFYFVDFPLNDSGLRVEERVSLIEDMVDYLAYYRKEDIFCEKGKNIEWTQEQIDYTLGRKEFITLGSDQKSEALRRLIGRLNATLWLYEEFVHTGRHQYCHDFHGPYSLDDDKVLLVRKHVGLRPSPVWSFTSNFLFDNITTFEVYQDVNIRLNCFNHIESSRSLPQCLQKFLVTAEDIDNPITNPFEIQDIQATAANIINEGNNLTTEFTKQDWLKKSVEMVYFSLDPHKKVLKEDWRPSKEMYDLIETEKADEDIKKLLKIAMEIAQKPKDEAFSALKKVLLENVYSE